MSMIPHRIKRCIGCLHEKESVECEYCKACKVKLDGGMTNFERNPEICNKCADYLRIPVCNQCDTEYDMFRPKVENRIDQEPIVPVPKPSKILWEVQAELDRANSLHAATFNSSNEAAGVIREEYMELEAELFHGDPARAREEAIQLAAMAVKAVQYLDGKAGGNHE